MSRYVFIHEDKSTTGSSNRVQVSIEDVALDDLIQAFESFLHACTFSGNLKIDYSYDDNIEPNSSEE